MRGLLFAGGLMLAALLAWFGWRHIGKLSSETFTVSQVAPPEAAPLCPWRQPEADLETFFPGATRYVTETRILSGLRLELSQRLGRVPTGDENALRLYEAYRSETPAGFVMTRRVKGDNGGIELVLATDTNGMVQGLRLQRLREPNSIAQALQATNWLHSFIGKKAEDPWRLGRDVPEVLPEAKSSAAALLEGTRSLLILLSASEQTQTPRLADARHH